MNKIVLDASAILALINGEPGHEKLTPSVLADAVCSTVNLAEVQAKLVTHGWQASEAWEDAMGPIREAIPFTEEHAKVTGALITHTRVLGLSLGDRACIALGMALQAPVFTAEQTWKKLKLGVEIQVIR